MRAEFRPVVDYEGLYVINRAGTVRSVPREVGSGSTLHFVGAKEMPYHNQRWANTGSSLSAR